MEENKKDVQRALAAARAIIDGRHPTEDYSKILVTAEHTIATLLLALFRDPRIAAAMMNEGLAPGVEVRLSMYASKRDMEGE